MASATHSSRVHPKKFNLWLMIIGIIMLFSGLTSAYIVRKADGNWLNFELPQVFLFSTIIVMISSLSMWAALRSAKADELNRLKLMLWITTLLGVAFSISQFLGWMNMIENELYFVNNQSEGDKISASFVFALSALHLLHVLGGIIFLIIMIFQSYKLKVHKKNTLWIEMCNTYWHFVGFLWVYLYLFLYFAPGF